MFAHGTTELPEGRPEGHSPRPGLAVRRLAEGLRRGSERPRRIQGWVIAVSAAAVALFLAAGVVLSFLFWSPQSAPDATSVYAWLTAVSTATALGLAVLAYERHRALVDARRSEASLQHLYESISDGVFRSTLDGRMISANPALVRLNGYANEAEFIRNCTDIANEWYVDPNRRAEIHQMVLEHGQVTNIVSEVYRHKTRERIWIEENVRLVRDEKNSRAALLRRHRARGHRDHPPTRYPGSLQQDHVDHVGVSAAAAVPTGWHILHALCQQRYLQSLRHSPGGCRRRFHPIPQPVAPRRLPSHRAVDRAFARHADAVPAGAPTPPQGRDREMGAGTFRTGAPSRTVPRSGMATWSTSPTRNGPRRRFTSSHISTR